MTFVGLQINFLDAASGAVSVGHGHVGLVAAQRAESGFGGRGRQRWTRLTGSRLSWRSVCSEGRRVTPDRSADAAVGVSAAEAAVRIPGETLAVAVEGGRRGVAGRRARSGRGRRLEQGHVVGQRRVAVVVDHLAKRGFGRRAARIRRRRRRQVDWLVDGRHQDRFRVRGFLLRQKLRVVRQTVSQWQRISRSASRHTFQIRRLPAHVAVLALLKVLVLRVRIRKVVLFVLATFASAAIAQDEAEEEGGQRSGRHGDGQRLHRVLGHGFIRSDPGA